MSAFSEDALSPISDWSARKTLDLIGLFHCSDIGDSVMLVTFVLMLATFKFINLNMSPTRLSPISVTNIDVTIYYADGWKNGSTDRLFKTGFQKGTIKV